MAQAVGLSYRPQFNLEFSRLKNLIDLLEIIPERYFNNKNPNELELVSSNFDVIPHSLSLSIGSHKSNNDLTFKFYKKLLDQIKPKCITDHLAVSKVSDLELDNFMPIHYSDEWFEIIKDNIKMVTTRLGYNLYLENIAYEFIWPNNEYSELEFWTKVLQETNAGMLLDVTNLYLNSVNHKYDPYEFFDKLPKDKINYIHVSGFIESDGFLVDSHSEPLNKVVIELLDHVIKNAPVEGIILERDLKLSSLNDVVDDINVISDLCR